MFRILINKIKLSIKIEKNHSFSLLQITILANEFNKVYCNSFRILILILQLYYSNKKFLSYLRCFISLNQELSCIILIINLFYNNHVILFQSLNRILSHLFLIATHQHYGKLKKLKSYAFCNKNASSLFFFPWRF